jgi:hypothetical protein
MLEQQDLLSKGLCLQNIRGRKEGGERVEESEQLDDKQRTLLFFSHYGIKGISAHFPHLRCLLLSHFLLSEVGGDRHFAVLKFTTYSFAKPHPCFSQFTLPRNTYSSEGFEVCSLRDPHNRE